MASNFGANYTNILETVPSVKVAAKDWHGKGRSVFDSFVQPAVVLAIGDKIFMGRLPAGAKIKKAILRTTDFGATGIVDVGYNYVDAALVASNVENGIFSAADINTKADTFVMSDADAASSFMVELLGEADVVIKVTTATDATGGTLKLLVEYVLE